MFFVFFIKAKFSFVFVFNRQKWAFVDGKEPWCDIGSCVKKEDERFRFKSCQFVTRSTHQVDLKNWLNSDMSAHKYAFKTKLNGWKSHFAELFWLSVSHCSDSGVPDLTTGATKTRILVVGTPFNPKRSKKHWFQPIRVANCFPLAEQIASHVLQREKVDVRDTQDSNSAHLVFTAFYVVHTHAFIIIIICRYLLEM